MFFNLKNIILTLVIIFAPVVLSYIDETCVTNSDELGVCVKASDCVIKKDQIGKVKTFKNYCPNDPDNVVCCIKDVTTMSSGLSLPVAGRCKNASQCSPISNTIYTSQCPGSGKVILCVPKTPQKLRQTSASKYKIIDLSRFNIVNNYDIVAKYVDGVVLRCGYRGWGPEGPLVMDPQFEVLYNGFAGKTKIGYYFFSQATSILEAEEEAAFVVHTLLKGKDVDFPIYWYSEDSSAPGNTGRADNLSKAKRTVYAIAFIKAIHTLGFRAGVYVPDEWFKNNLDYDKIVKTCASIWIAGYGTPTISKYDAWRYTSSGSIDGINGDVDISHVFTNIAW